MPTRHPLMLNRNLRRTETHTLSCIAQQVHAHSSPQRRSRRWVTPMWCLWLVGSSTGRLKASPSSQREGEGRPVRWNDVLNTYRENNIGVATHGVPRRWRSNERQQPTHPSVATLGQRVLHATARWHA